MSPVIRVSDATYARLQQLAKPFVDTPDSVIARLLDAMPATNGRGPDATDRPVPTPGTIQLDPHAPDSLKHTRVRYASFAGQIIERPNWNKLLRVAHAVALKHLGSFAALRRASGANLREGRYENEGFAYLAESNFSLQGADANHSWHHSFRLARQLGVPVEVMFEWHGKGEAAHPGKSGHLRWSPKPD